MSETKTPLETITEAARRMRQLAEEANTDEARRPYSDPRVDPVPESQWGRLVDNYLGGEIGVYCAAWTPTVALAISEMLAQFVADYQTDTDYPECPNCGSCCGGHDEVTYHMGCGEDLDQCHCLTPYLDLAQIFLGAGMFVGG